MPPSRFFMPYRIPAATLDFLDATHLLFTFHVARLMHREPDDPAEDQDQTIRAVVLSLPDGKVEGEGTWRLHDRNRYLWTLGNGQFLLRQRNRLSVGDKTLVLHDYLHPEGTLASVQVSPDGKTLIAQYSKPVEIYDEAGDRLTPPSLGDDAPSDGERAGGRAQQYTLLVIDTESHRAKRAGPFHHPVALPVLEGGYLGAEHGKGKQWAVSMHPFHGDSHAVTTVTSTCQPRLEPISARTFITQSCLPVSTDRLVEAFDLGGHKLWEQIWQSRFAWGSFAFSASGSRFAYESIEVNHDLGNFDPVDPSSILGQPVGVFAVATGKPELVLDAAPILTAGENFTLSPDGDRLAILRNGAIEVYALPSLGGPGTGLGAGLGAGPGMGEGKPARTPVMAHP